MFVASINHTDSDGGMQLLPGSQTKFDRGLILKPWGLILTYSIQS